MFGIIPRQLNGETVFYPISAIVRFTKFRRYNKKMIYAKIMRDGMGSYIQPLESLMDALDAEFDGVEQWAEEGDSIIIKFIEMDERDYENLSEFEGW
jgi:hypothetical protein